uniref:Uncharacterized protein n=1 Tax=Brassica campestris TaxID=3711 RepID=M4EV73_BRACM
MSSSQGGKRSSDVEMGEATSPAPIPTSSVEAPTCVTDHLSFREKLACRKAEKEPVRAGTEFPSSSVLAVAPDHGTEVKVLQDAGTLAGSSVPDTSVLPAGSSTTPILVEDKERAAESMPPPPVRKEIVLALRAPSAVPVAQPKGRKRKFTKGSDGDSSQQGGSSLASGLRGKFMSLIDGMISECGSEASRLAGDLSELQGRWSETEVMLTAVKDSHSAKVSKLEVEIGELERNLGKTTGSLLKEKKARKAKYLEVRRLQRQIEGDAGSASRGIREATNALRSEFQARLAKISAFLGSLECIRSRDLALATIEGGMTVVRAFQSETPSSFEAEETRVADCKGDLAAVDGDFDLVLADLKSACFLPTCSVDPLNCLLRFVGVLGFGDFPVLPPPFQRLSSALLFHALWTFTSLPVLQTPEGDFRFVSVCLSYSSAPGNLLCGVAGFSRQPTAYSIRKCSSLARCSLLGLDNDLLCLNLWTGFLIGASSSMPMAGAGIVNRLRLLCSERPLIFSLSAGPFRC